MRWSILSQRLGFIEVNATELRTFESSIVIASRMLAMIARLSVRTNLFKKFRPNPVQIWWSYGFCDSYAQSIGALEDGDHFLFISVVLENVYGKRGQEYFAEVFAAPERFSQAMSEGGTAHFQWRDTGSIPLMPHHS